jgi:endo-1,3(4)-beta-glucanase
MALFLITTSALALVTSFKYNVNAAAPNAVAGRGEFGLFEPFSFEEPPKDLFPYTDAQKNLAPPRFLNKEILGQKPIQTNDWWGNYIAFDNEQKLQPSWTNPYSIRPLNTDAPFGYAVNYPYRSRREAGRSGNGDASKYYLHGSLNEVILSATEFTGGLPSFEVTGWDDVGLQMHLLSNGGKGELSSSIVSGMAYATVNYNALTPRISSVHGLITINGKPLDPKGEYKGTSFILTMNSDQTWAIYTSEPVTFQLEGKVLIATKKFNGHIRVALIPNSSSQQVFDKYASCIVTGGDIEARDASTYQFLWKTIGDCSNGLLHYAHVHHLDSIDRNSAKEVDGVSTNSTTRGPMQAFVTKTSPPVWTLIENEDIPVDFYPVRKPSADLVKSNKIREALVADIEEPWEISLNGSYYFNGKLAQKYGSLCLMANDAETFGKDEILLEKCLSKLRQVITPMLTNEWANELQYDVIYRGLVSSEGFNKNDFWADFGNTVYNDHHYHYGYWIVSAAIVNYLDPTWDQLAQLNRIMSFMVRDVANPSTEDPYFPKFRNFDWFRGHSYSHGVTPFADGKDEESTSEDINFHYGLYLYGKVTKNFRLEQMGKLMMKLNAHAIKTYFLISSDNKVHPNGFLPNGVTGIFFDNKVDYGSWFSSEKHCINGIQMLPVSPVTEFVRTKKFIEEEWKNVLSNDPIVLNRDYTNGWLSLLYSNYAAINRDVALTILQKAALDDGLTRSWALYMAATRI